MNVPAQIHADRQPLSTYFISWADVPTIPNSARVVYLACGVLCPHETKSRQSSFEFDLARLRIRTLIKVDRRLYLHLVVANATISPGCFYPALTALWSFSLCPESGSGAHSILFWTFPWATTKLHHKLAKDWKRTSGSVQRLSPQWWAGVA